MKNKLEIGDKVSEKYSGKLVEMGEVTRVTPTQAIVKFSKKEIRLKLEFRDESNIIMLNRQIWDSEIYSLATESDFLEIKRMLYIKKIEGFNFNKLTNEKLENILRLLNEG